MITGKNNELNKAGASANGAYPKSAESGSEGSSDGSDGNSENSPDGDMIDCVHISHQPAFDHPFLKDHKIQMRPNYHPEGLYDENRVSNERENRIKQLWRVSGTCPEDTIPIRRTKEDDVLRASSVKRYGKKKHTISRNITPNSADSDLDNESGHQHAIAYVEGDKYYGAKATMNVWEPKMQQPNEFSLSQIWILGGSFGEDLNSIEAGWQLRSEVNKALKTAHTGKLIGSGLEAKVYLQRFDDDKLAGRLRNMREAKIDNDSVHCIFIISRISISLSANYHSIWISWITGEFQIGDSIKPLDPDSVAIVVQYGKVKSLNKHTQKAEGHSLIYNQLYPFEGLHNYTSGIIHHVQLTGLSPDTVYYYRCGYPSIGAMSECFVNFLSQSEVLKFFDDAYIHYL